MADSPATHRSAELPAVRLDPAPSGIRVFEARRPVRFGDADRLGQVRLDALATYPQDVAGDDTADVGVRDVGGWIVRRSVFEVVRPPTFGQELTLATWASGAGSRWAERRLSITAPARAPGGADGQGQARVEAVSLWVYVDPATLRPAPLDAGFETIYGPSTRGRVVSSRLSHPTKVVGDEPVERLPWRLRAADIDAYGHVNNAATWAIVEEVLADRPVPAPFRAELEYRAPIEPGVTVVIEIQAPSDGGVALWARDAGAGTLYASARVVPLPG